jgi:uncharacterized membrane protein YfhO
MDKDSYLYMYLPTSYERSCNIWYIDEEQYQSGETSMNYAGQFFVGDNYSIMNLGKFTEGQEIRIRVTISNDDNEAYWSDQLFYTFDYDTFSETCAQLQQSSLEITDFDDTSLEGTVTAENDGDLLFTTIPYEEGWTIKVNGETVDPTVTLDSLIAIPLESGENTITMKFSPNYWKFSIVITLMGILVFAVIFMFEYKKGKYMKIVIAKIGGNIQTKLSDTDSDDDSQKPEQPEYISPDNIRRLYNEVLNEKSEKG